MEAPYDEAGHVDHVGGHGNPEAGDPESAFDFLPCIINDETPVSCVKHLESRQVFVPFDFIRKYFEVSDDVMR